MCQSRCRFEDSFTGDCTLGYCYFEQLDEEGFLEEEKLQYQIAKYEMERIENGKKSCAINKGH